MSDRYTPNFLIEWRDRSQISGDVVYFPYATFDLSKKSKVVFVMDLDKTYLDTAIDSIRGLINAAIEKAFQKKNVPGTATLVQSMGQKWKREVDQELPLYFITGSPPQLEKRIREKLELDGVKPYGIFCKDNMQNLSPKRLWRLTQQVGFKLQALMQLRMQLANDVRQVMFGDDSESDAIIYSLYSDICSRRMSEDEVRKILKSFRVVGSQMNSILDLVKKIPIQDPVEKIYINLAADTDSEYYTKFGRRTVPTYNSFQAALDMLQDERLAPSDVITVGCDLMKNFGFSKDELSKYLDDLIRRRIFSCESLNQILPELQSAKLVSSHFSPSLRPLSITEIMDNERGEATIHEPWIPDHIDYLHDYR